MYQPLFLVKSYEVNVFCCGICLKCYGCIKLFKVLHYALFFSEEKRVEYYEFKDQITALSNVSFKFFWNMTINHKMNAYAGLNVSC